MVDTFGLKKIWVKPLEKFGSPTVGNDFWKNASAAENTSGWRELGDVFQDSATLSEDEQSKETFRSETSARKITIYGKTGDLSIDLELMSPDLDLMALYFGGTTTTDSNGKKTWKRPANFSAKPFAIMIMPENGLMLKCPQVSIAPRLGMDYTETGVFKVPLKISLIDEVTFTEDTASPIFSE